MAVRHSPGWKSCARPGEARAAMNLGEGHLLRADAERLVWAGLQVLRETT